MDAESYIGEVIPESITTIADEGYGSQPSTIKHEGYYIHMQGSKVNVLDISLDEYISYSKARELMRNSQNRISDHSKFRSRNSHPWYNGRGNGFSRNRSYPIQANRRRDDSQNNFIPMQTLTIPIYRSDNNRFPPSIPPSNNLHYANGSYTSNTSPQTSMLPTGFKNLPINSHPNLVTYNQRSPHNVSILQQQTPPIIAEIPNSRTILVGNIDKRVTTKILVEFLSQQGTVEQANIFYDSNQVSTGFGLATFDSPRVAAKVINHLHDRYVDGRKLTVSSVPTPQNPTAAPSIASSVFGEAGNNPMYYEPSFY